MKTYTAPQGLGIFNRGKPAPAEHELFVHLYIPKSRDGCHEARPKCGNGAYHIVFTSDPGKVTCPACKEASK